MRRPPFPLSDARGIALVKVMLVTAVMLALAAFGSQAARTEIRIARNDLQARQAFAYADAGVNHVFELMKNGGAAVSLTTALSSGGTGGILQDGSFAAPPDGTTDRRFAHLAGATADGYYVKIEDNYDESGTDAPSADADRQVYIVSKGRAGAASREIRALVKQQLGASCAIETNGYLWVNGNVTVSGVAGCAHSNTVGMLVQGSPSFSVAPDTGGWMELSGNPSIEGASIGNAEEASYESGHSYTSGVTIPSLNPLAFGPGAVNLSREIAQAGGYILDSDCTVRQGASAECSDATGFPCSGGSVVTPSGGQWPWDCDSGSSPTRWRVSGNGNPTQAPFFVNGRVEISGSPGSPGNPWNTAIVATNSIGMTGDPTLAPLTSAGNLANILLASGNDVRLRGTLGTSGAPAGIFAHQQIDFAGTSTVNGFVVAEDGASTIAGWPGQTKTSGYNYAGSMSEFDSNSAGGNITINYDGVSTIAIPATYTMLTWNGLGGSR